MIRSHVYLAATILLSVYSQLTIKWRMATRFRELSLPPGIWGKVALLFTIVFDPFVFASLAATFASGLFWMATMRKLEISYAYPFTSLGFVLVLVLSHFLLGESFGLAKAIGTLFIIVGVAIAARGM